MTTWKVGMNKSWWRRNMWGLLLVPLLTVGLLAFEAKSLYHDYYSREPMEPVPVDITGRAVIDEFAFRLIEVKPVETDYELEKTVYFGHPKPPATVKVWRALLAVETSDDSNSTLCETALEDEQGRRYEDAPSELGGESNTFQGCSRDEEKQPVPYTATFYYLLPRDARPTTLIVTWPLSKTPRFVELHIP